MVPFVSSTFHFLQIILILIPISVATVALWGVYIQWNVEWYKPACRQCESEHLAWPGGFSDTEISNENVGAHFVFSSLRCSIL